MRALARDAGRCDALRGYGCEIALGDLRDRESLLRAAKGTSVVYHLGALFRKDVARREMWEVNVEGTRHLLEAAQEAGVERFVHCSTVGVHGDVKSPPADEAAPYNPSDDYEATKCEGERVVVDHMSSGKLPIVIVRPGGIYGPGDLRFLKLFKTIRNGTFVMLGSGETRYQMIYVTDLIDGILLCGTRPEAIGNTYILTGAESVSLNALVAMIARVLGVRTPRLRFPVAPVYLAAYLCELLCKPIGIHPPLYRRRVNFFTKTRIFDISKAKRQLGFSPKIGLEDGIRLTRAWYKEAGHL